MAGLNEMLRAEGVAVQYGGVSALEPLFVHRWLLTRAEAAPEATFRLIQGLHWLLLSLSIIVIFGAVGGSHGFLLFG